MTTDLSNFDKRWSDAHFGSFLFYYYCTVMCKDKGLRKNYGFYWNVLCACILKIVIIRILSITTFQII